MQLPIPSHKFSKHLSTSLEFVYLVKTRWITKCHGVAHKKEAGKQCISGKVLQCSAYCVDQCSVLKGSSVCFRVKLYCEVLFFVSNCDVWIMCLIFVYFCEL